MPGRSRPCATLSTRCHAMTQIRRLLNCSQLCCANPHFGGSSWPGHQVPRQNWRSSSLAQGGQEIIPAPQHRDSQLHPDGGRNSSLDGMAAPPGHSGPQSGTHGEASLRHGLGASNSPRLWHRACGHSPSQHHGPPEPAQLCAD